MGAFVAQRTIKLLTNAGLPPKNCKIGILGITFKENVSDVRNSRVPDIVEELQQFGVNPLVHDPLADPLETQELYGIRLKAWSELSDLDALVYAVKHNFYLSLPYAELLGQLRPRGVVIDIKAVLDPETIPSSLHYWSL